jgi:hypothetical protein
MTDNPRIHIGANGGPPLVEPKKPTPFEMAQTEILDLYATAKDFADGEPIASAEMAEVITKLHDALHEAGRAAEALRVAEKKPLDDLIDEIQSRYNPLVQPKKGRVALGKEALAALLTPWRAKVAAEKAARAAAAAADAARLQAEATAAIRASSGNLEAREKAEEMLETAKEAGKFAKREDKRATTGTGLRTVWIATLTDAEAALNWAYEKDPAAFTALVQSMADAAVRGGARDVPGFTVNETKVAA